MIKVETERIADVAIVTLVGEIDTRGNQTIDRTLRELAAKKIYKIILDISFIRFVGTQTVSILLSNLKELRSGGGDIKILNPQRTVLQYLKQNRMIELFQIFSSKAEALKAYHSVSTANFANANTFPSSAATADTVPTPQPAETQNQPDSAIKARFETGEILYANSCMIATLIKLLQEKGLLTTDEANELMDYERLSIKGVTE